MPTRSTRRTNSTALVGALALGFGSLSCNQVTVYIAGCETVEVGAILALTAAVSDDDASTCDFSWKALDPAGAGEIASEEGTTATFTATSVGWVRLTVACDGPDRGSEVDDSDSCSVEIVLPDSLDGTWDAVFTVEEASGVCEGEVGEETELALELEHDEETDELVIRGFEGDLDNSVTGELTGDTVTWEGSWTEESGLTKSSAELNLSYDEMRLEGTEDWDWLEDEDGEVTCPEGVSSVVMTRR